MASPRIISGRDFEYAFYERLGCGAHGKVYRGRNVSNGEYCALKFFDVPTSQKAADREIRAMTVLSGGPHIVQMKFAARGVMKPRKRRADPRMSDLLVMELCSNGAIIETLLTSGRLSEAISRTYYVHLLEAVAFAHARNIVHR